MIAINRSNRSQTQSIPLSPRSWLRRVRCMKCPVRPRYLAKTPTALQSLFANFKRNRMEGVMRALFDQNGEVRIWLRDDAQWLLDLHGNALASVHEGGIYDSWGRHVAWWRGDRILDHYGNVIFVTQDVQHLQMLKPIWHLRPLPPPPKMMPLRPILGLRPIESLTSGRWGNSRAFLDALRCRVRSA